MYDLRRLQHLANGARLGAVLALGLAHLQVSAQGAGPLEMPQRLDRFHIWVNGNIVTNKYASEAEEYGIRMAQNARIYGRAETGGVSLSKQLAINTKNGIVVAEAKQLLNARSIAKGIGSVATGGGALGLALLAAPYVYQYLKDGGFDVENGQVMKPGSDPGGYLDNQEYSRSTTGPWYPDWATPCAQVKPSYALAVVEGWPQYSNLYHCQYTVPSPPYAPGTIHSVQIYRRTQTSPPPPLPSQPVTAQEIEDALATKNPTPEVLKELAEKGGHAPKPDPSNPPKIENPQPSQEKTTTKTNPDGSSETTTCRTNGTVQGNTLKLTESCTITKKDPQGNTTGTTTTNSDDADPVPKADESLLCSVFPNIAACAELDTPEGDIPTASETIGYTAENHFGGGSCPADKAMTLATTGQAMTVWNWSQACNAITDYFRPLFITLCTLTALFILAPGVKEGA